MLMGLEPITPTVIVRYIQNKRRRLRAIKSRGIQRTNSKKCKNQKNKPNQSLSMLARFFGLSKLLNCGGYSIVEESEEIVVSNKTPKQTKESINEVGKRSRDQVDDDDDESDSDQSYHDFLNHTITSSDDSNDPTYKTDNGSESQSIDDSFTQDSNSEDSNTEDAALLNNQSAKEDKDNDEKEVKSKQSLSVQCNPVRLSPKIGKFLNVFDFNYINEKSK